MIAIDALWTFSLMVGLLTLTPGLDTALVLRTAALGHRRRAWGVVLGIQSGTLIWGTLTSLGVTALLTASHLAYEILRWAGAAYLVWMGGRLLRSTWRRSADEAPETPGNRAEVPSGAGSGDSLLGGWRQGLTTNLLNPKMGAFYVAMLPQFLPADTSHLAAGVLLTGIHILLAVLWAGVLITLGHVLRDRLQQPTARRWLDRVTGTVIAAFGVRLALGE
ncbi:putative LysE family transporter [Streptomyces lydicamycinicus]|jgi:threonine/homoserine/homoserine lactone efflux protein|uniref:Putative LysE family transporter n=1 Tax=Streptomyces lydicamycinicus TaxID=1546107 RepID=A0A0P4R5F6_9ACTN|nr:LysE family translocator [Streptomyces lydicamycinicus]GAO07586.1 putative LysE family transporter [Streptomyces lydicamycinicus]